MACNGVGFRLLCVTASAIKMLGIMASQSIVQYFRLSFRESSHLRLQDQLSSCLPALNVLSCPHNIAQRVNIVDLDIQFILLDEVPEFLGSLQYFLACGEVVEQGGTDEFDVLR